MDVGKKWVAFIYSFIFVQITFNTELLGVGWLYNKHKKVIAGMDLYFMIGNLITMLLIEILH